MMTDLEIRLLWEQMTDGQREIFMAGVLAERERILNITRLMTKEAVDDKDTDKLMFLSDVGGRILRGAKTMDVQVRNNE
jgi:hypothetical protein